jgi:putative sigma-54 modulation protein
MRIEVKGRNLAVTDELRTTVERRFEKVSKQVSDLAVLDVEVWEERNPANPEGCVAEATLHLKGTTLRAKDASRDHRHAINLVADDMSRLVKRHRDKRRNRREARAVTATPPAPIDDAAPPPGSVPAT